MTTHANPEPICPLCKNPMLDGDCVISRQGLTFHAGCGEGPLAWPVVMEAMHQRIAALETQMRAKLAEAIADRDQSERDEANAEERAADAQADRNRLAAQVDELTRELDMLRHDHGWNDLQADLAACRSALREIATTVGGTVGEMCSNEFHCLVRGEVQSVVDRLKADLAAMTERAALWEKRAAELAHDPKADARPVIEEWREKAERAWAACHAAKEDAERAKAERNGMHVKNYREMMDARDEADALRAEVAALKGLKVKLPPKAEPDWGTLADGYTYGFNEALAKCADAIRAAGGEVSND